jgi:hypothetical protein
MPDKQLLRDCYLCAGHADSKGEPGCVCVCVCVCVCGAVRHGVT